MPTIYRKSDQGRREIQTRALGLGPRARRALILVDGQRDDDALGQLLGHETQQALAQLEAQGYIEVVAITTVVPRPIPTGAPPDRVARSLPPDPIVSAVPPDDLRGAAAAELSRLLGANARMSMSAAVAARKIERAATASDLTDALRQAERLIAMGAGSAAAAEFRAGFLG